MYAPSLATRQPSGISSPDPCAGKAQINEFTKGRLGNLRQHLSVERMLAKPLKHGSCCLPCPLILPRDWNEKLLVVSGFFLPEKKYICDMDHTLGFHPGSWSPRIELGSLKQLTEEIPTKRKILISSHACSAGSCLLFSFEVSAPALISIPTLLSWQQPFQSLQS